MIYSVQQIKFDVYSYIKEFDSEFDDWYIGISNDPKTKMLAEHNVDEAEDIWLYRQALSLRACQTIQRHFVEGLGVSGEPVVEGRQGGNCIYLYKKSPRTCP